MELYDFILIMEYEFGEPYTTKSGQVVDFAADWDSLLKLARKKRIDVPKDPAKVSEVLNKLGEEHEYAEYFEKDLVGDDGKAYGTVKKVFWR